MPESLSILLESLYICQNPCIYARILVYIVRALVYMPEPLYICQNPCIYARTLVYIPESLYICQNPCIYARILVYTAEIVSEQHTHTCAIYAPGMRAVECFAYERPPKSM